MEPRRSPGEPPSAEKLDRLANRDGTNGVIVVDTGRIAGNWRSLAARVAPAECAAVVKADCYGLGEPDVFEALAQAGAATFFVALPAEAEDVRGAVPGAEVFVLDGVLPGQEADLLQAGGIPVLSSLPEIQHWAAYARERNERLPAALHIDSGLNRLGLEAAEIERIAGDPMLLEGIDLRLVMSHLACADEPEHPKNRAQLDVFRDRSARLPASRRSLAASDGLMLGPDYHFEMVRPGYALYGGQALPGRITPVEPVVEVYARVLQVRTLIPGDTVGYSATFEAERPSRIAVVASGYADGAPRHLSAESGTVRGHVAFDGHLAPIVGRVSMDLITVDVTDVPEAIEIQRGTWAELIGPSITLEDVGHAAGTIGYEVLTRLSPRFSVLYRGKEGGDG